MESKALAERETNCQMHQPGIEPGAPENTADALPRRYRDRRHPQWLNGRASAALA